MARLATHASRDRPPILYRFLSIGHRIGSVTLLLCCGQAAAEQVSVPMLFGTPLLQQQVVDQVFTDSDQSALVWDDGSGCNYMVLLTPRANADREGLTFTSRAEARVGRLIGKRCLLLLEWRGTVAVLSRPVLTNDGTAIGFVIGDSRLRNERGDREIPGTLWDWTKQYVHPRFEKAYVDLSPALTELKLLIPQLAAGDDKARVAAVLATIRVRDVTTETGGVRASLVFDIPPQESVPTTAPEPPLSDEEFAGFELALQQYDAFMTFIVKNAAAETEDHELRDELLEILLEVRHQLLDAATVAENPRQDPVRVLFLESWRRLAPLLRQISSLSPGQSALNLMSFITAADALQGIDALGPSFGLEISTQALRRMARLMAPADTDDPLHYDETVDPQLRGIFDFGAPRPPPAPAPGSSWLIPNVYAAIAWDRKSIDRLNRWLPRPAELRGYLTRVGLLLEDTADAIMQERPLAKPYQAVFRPLVLATAWQETCWRQFTVKNDKRWPIKSSAGAVGMMQVMPRVWRGFYDPHSLSWDIAYNAEAGGEILRFYLDKYAIRKKEHEQAGGLHNLARATYAVYNGGPRHLRRYRSTDTPQRLRRIDHAFWDKYRAIRAGKTLPVLECYG